MALTAQIALSIIAHETSAGDLSRTLRATPAAHTVTLTDGTGAGQAQVVWSDSRTLPIEGIEDIDFEALQDDRGQIELSEVTVLYVKNTHPTGRLFIGYDWIGEAPPSPVPWAPASLLGGGMKLRPGTSIFLHLAAQGQVTTNQSKMRFSTEEGESASYEIVVIGKGSVL